MFLARLEKVSLKALHLRNMILDDHGKLWLLDWWRTINNFAAGLLGIMGVDRDAEEVQQLMATGFSLTTGGFT
jgi:hypothetical protein